jgi:hypothetical protein
MTVLNLHITAPYHPLWTHGSKRFHCTRLQLPLCRPELCFGKFALVHALLFSVEGRQASTSSPVLAGPVLWEDVN